MIVFDELPTRSLLDESGGIDRERFPSFAELADGSTWYSHHTTEAGLTRAAVPSLLTGQAPNTDPAVYTEHPDNLFTMLAPTHDLEVMETATQLCPYDSCPPTVDGKTADAGGARLGDLLGEVRSLWRDRVALGPTAPLALDDFEEDIEPEVADSTTATTEPAEPAGRGRPGFVPDDDQLRANSARADTFVDAFDASKGPALYFLHLMLPHQPWRRYPDGSIYQDHDPLGATLPEADQEARFTWAPWVATVTEQRHLLQLQYTDQVLGAIVQGLRDAGLYDESVIVVVGDHGASFEVGTSVRASEPSTLDSIAYTPLFVKAAAPDRRRGRRRERDGLRRRAHHRRARRSSDDVGRRRRAGRIAGGGRP